MSDASENEVTFTKEERRAIVENSKVPGGFRFDIFWKLVEEAKKEKIAKLKQGA